ncbi:MAG: DUF308 domain-containing protein, partial [Candidatus Methanoperedens sp.]|nr:DUF308 domain-containing protein [Candidatus Methanoperedens sp.]
GVAIVQHPLYAAILVPTVLIVVLGIQGIAIGIAELVIAFRGGGLGAIILGVLSIVFGVVLIANPLVGVIALPWIMGIAGLVGGIGAIIGAFRNR